MRAPFRTAALVLILLLGSTMSAPAAASPDGAVWFEATFPSLDGTPLHADVFRPAHLAPDERTPVILNIGPYNGTGPVVEVAVNGRDPLTEGPAPAYPELFERGRLFARGYTYVQVDLRGFGSSGGCGDVFGPGEQADAQAAVEWTASQPWSTGRVGMYGKSYDATTQLMAMARGARGLAAVVLQAPTTSLHRAHFMGAVRYDPTTYYAANAYYAALDLDPPGHDKDPAQHQQAAAGTLGGPRCYAENLTGELPSDPNAPYWRERDLLALRPQGSDVPALVVQGFWDASAKPDHLTRLWPWLTGPKRLVAGHFEHFANFPTRDPSGAAIDEAMRWFDEHLRGARPDRDDPAVVVQSNDGAWRAEATWPPRDARPVRLSVRPGTYRDLPGNSAEPAAANALLRGTNPAPLPTGRGAWTLGEPLPAAVHLSGVPSLRADVDATAGATLIALLYDVAPDGTATLLSRGARRVDGPGEAHVELYPTDWRVAAGHRIGVLLTGADDPWFEPGTTATTVAVLGGEMNLPALRRERTATLADGRSTATSARYPFQIESRYPADTAGAHRAADGPAARATGVQPGPRTVGLTKQ